MSGPYIPTADAAKLRELYLAGAITADEAGLQDAEPELDFRRRVGRMKQATFPGLDEPTDLPPRLNRPAPRRKESAPPRAPVPDPVRPISETPHLDGKWEIVRLNMGREYDSELQGPLYDFDALRAGLRGAVGYLSDEETLAVCRLIREYFSRGGAAEPHQKGDDDE